MAISKGLFYRGWFTLTFLAVCRLANSEPLLYQAALHEAGWEIQSSVFECRLVQKIPQYGEVQFFHRAGESLEFRVLAFNDVFGVNELTLVSVPPPWDSQKAVRDLGSLHFSARGSTLWLDARMARMLMQEMLTGMMPTFKSTANDVNREAVMVVLSPLHFQKAYSQYLQCSSELLPVNFEQVQRSTIFWKEGAMQLDAETKNLLSNIVLYSKADPSISGFEVDSFTDSTGERHENLLVSEARAFMVTNFLISQGVDREMIATRAHGEREEYMIVNPELTRADRDRNRRVNIVLLRSF